MIFELKKGRGVFVRADKIEEITIVGEFTHVYMASGHVHLVERDPKGDPYDDAKSIMRRANEAMRNEDAVSDDHPTYSLIDNGPPPDQNVMWSKVGRRTFPFGNKGE